MMARAKSAARSTPWAVVLLSLPAGVAIWSGWVGIGTLCGFGKVEPLPGLVDGLVIDTRITLPIGMETYAAVALRAWLTSQPGDVRTFAKWSALAALSVGAAGQIAYHLMVAAGITAAPWPVVAAVATLPVAVLGMGAALAHLRHGPETPGASVVTALADAPGSTTRPATSPAETAPNAGAGAGRPDRTDRTDRNTFPQVSSPQLRQASSDRNSRRPDRNARRTPNRPMHGDPNALALLVRELTEAQPDWTQAQVATEAGCSVRTVRRHQSTPPPASGPALAPAVAPEASPAEPIPTPDVPESREDDAA